MEKIAFLKSLGVHEWDLREISSVRLRAYGQALANRPPSQSRLLLIGTQQLEAACFLRMMLQEFTDVALFMAGRRVCDLVRHASAIVIKNRLGERHTTVNAKTNCARFSMQPISPTPKK